MVADNTASHSCNRTKQTATWQVPLNTTMGHHLDLHRASSAFCVAVWHQALLLTVAEMPARISPATCSSKATCCCCAPPYKGQPPVLHMDATLPQVIHAHYCQDTAANKSGHIKVRALRRQPQNVARTRSHPGSPTVAQCITPAHVTQLRKRNSWQDQLHCWMHSCASWDGALHG